jgi:transcriptional regulator with XRE-family HTH domain
MQKNSFDEYIAKEIQKKPGLEKDIRDAVQAFSIAQQLYDLRKSRGLTQAEFAKSIGVSQPNVARLESGDYKSYSIRTLNKAVAALNSSMEIKITPLESTQTVCNQWVLGPLTIAFDSDVEHSGATDISISQKRKESPLSSSFYNIATC